MARPACVVALVAVVSVPSAAYAQSAQTPSTWIGVAVSGEHARFSQSFVEPALSHIVGTQPTVSLRVSRLVSHGLGVGLDVDISRSHELVRHFPFPASPDGRAQVSEEVATVRNRFTTFTVRVDYSLGLSDNWTATVTAGASFTRLRSSFRAELVPPSPSRSSGGLSEVRIDVGPAVGLEVGRALGKRWSLFGDLRVVEVSGQESIFKPQGFLIRPGFGFRVRL